MFEPPKQTEAFQDYALRKIAENRAKIVLPDKREKAAYQIMACLRFLFCKMNVTESHRVANELKDLPDFLRGVDQPSLAVVVDLLVIHLRSREAEGMELKALSRATSSISQATSPSN